MWHVCSNKFQFSLWLLFGSCLCEFVWYGFSQICILIYYLRNHLFHIILTMALPVGLNSWNYQQTLLKYGALFLISCHIFQLVRIFLDTSITGKIIPNGHCPWTIHIYVCDRIFLIILTLALDFICPISCQKYLLLTPFAFLASCMDPNFQIGSVQCCK